MSAFSEVQTGTARFLGWWGQELGGLMPARLRGALTPSQARLVLFWSRDGVRPVLTDREDGAPVADGPVLSPDRMDRTALAAAVPNVALDRPVTIVLDTDCALIQAVTLPLAAEATLQDVIRYELDRLTPFSAEEAYTAGRIRRRDPARQTLDADLVLVPRKGLDPVLDTAKRCGLQVERVDVGRDEAGGPGGLAGVNLIAGTGPRTGPGLGAKVFMGLMIMALVLGGSALGIGYGKRQSVLDTVDAELDRVRRLALRFDVARQEEAERRGRREVVTRLKADAPLAVEVLEEVTRLLPDDSFLESFRLTQDGLTIAGQSAQAAALIAAFEASPLFAGVAFNTPTVQAKATGRESFSLAMRLVPREGQP
ncbi:MAG: PilN domain-containing protein [Alphaproteobacteria bacterium]